MRRLVGFLVAFVCLAAVAAQGQIRRADFVLLTGDTDDAIQLAKNIKDVFSSDPMARRAVSQARDAVIQSWLEDKLPLQLTDQERATLQNPEQYDRLVLRDVTVTFGASAPSLVLGWDVSPRLWSRISAAVVPVVSHIVRDAAVTFRRGLRGSVTL